jgi:anaerobic selenocysteine-containing dehydrogenase
VRRSGLRGHLAVPEMLDALEALRSEPEAEDPALPLVLIAGDRRAYNANQIYRDPAWRRNDPEGALQIHPEDARRFGLEHGGRALLPGVVSLPHGYGMDYPAADGTRIAAGPALNLLTDAGHRDPIAATPYHKHVRVRLRPVA